MSVLAEAETPIAPATARPQWPTTASSRSVLVGFVSGRFRPSSMSSSRSFNSAIGSAKRSATRSRSRSKCSSLGSGIWPGYGRPAADNRFGYQAADAVGHCLARIDGLEELAGWPRGKRMRANALRSHRRTIE